MELLLQTANGNRRQVETKPSEQKEISTQILENSERT
jgi:hypothetical protein